MDQRKRSKLQWLQNSSQINGDNLQNLRREMCRTLLLYTYIYILLNYFSYFLFSVIIIIIIIIIIVVVVVVVVVVSFLYVCVFTDNLLTSQASQSRHSAMNFA
jgi:hypothetical protein